MSETIKFWFGMTHRGESKRLDKIIIGNSDTEGVNYIDVSELLKALNTDDLNESQTKKYITPELLQKLDNLSEGNYTLEQLGQYFYPKNTNPEGYLTSESELAAAKITGIIAAALIPGLAASKITNGTFGAARIPDLSANKITSGVFDLARIPNIPSNKLEDFTTELGKYVLKTARGASNGVAPLNENSQLPEAYIQNLSANKITAGTFAESLIPSVFLKLSQIVDDLTSEDPEALLSANQGRILNEKINGIAGSKWLGEFTSKANLLAAYPEGDEQLWHENLPGWNADVDAGEGEDIEHYIFDLSDKEWVKQLGRSNVETATSVQQKYESNPDTYRLTEVRKNKVDSLPERIVGNIPLEADKIPVSRPDGSIEWQDKPTGTGGGSSRPNPLVVLNNYELTTANKDQLLRCENTTNILIPQGLGLDFRCVIKKATDLSVGLVGSPNIIIETPSGFIPEILSKNDAIEIVCEKIENGIEYYGVYGALTETGEIEYKTVLNIANTSTVSVAWPYLYKSSEWPEINTTKDYFLIYSSDHETASAGAIYWAECDSPELDGFTERGVIKNEYQSEFAWLVRIPTSESGLTSDEIFLYYHTNTSDPDNGSAQQTHLITTSGGDLDDANIWTQRGKVLGIESGENHTGYLKVYKRGVGDYVGHHIVTGGTPRHEWVSTSPDGLVWTREYEWDYSLYTPNGGDYGRSSVEPFNYNSELHGFIDYRDGNGDKQLAIVKLDQDFQPLEFVKTVLIAEYEDKTVFIEDNTAYIYFRLGEVGTGQNPADYFLYKINILTL